MIASELIALNQPLVIVPGLMLCAVFLVMWDSNRRATHLLLWSAGFAVGSLTFAVSPLGGPRAEHPAVYLAALGFCSVVGLGLIAAGLVRFTGRRIDWRNIGVLLALILVSILVTVRWREPGIALFDLATFGVYCALAWRLLSGTPAERMAGLLFLARGINALSLTRLMPGYDFLEWAQVCQYLQLGAGTALLCASFQRASADAGGAHRLFDIVESAFAQLSGLGDRAVIHSQLATLLYQVGDAARVAVYELDRPQKLLRLRARAGEAVMSGEIPIGALHDVLGTQRARGGTAASGDPGRFALAAGEADILCFPLAVGARVFGVAFLGLRTARVPQGPELAALEAVGRAAGFALATSEQREKLRHTASHDLTTGLANRACLHDEYELRRDQGGLENGAIVLLLGLPAFREVNRAHGHYTGDRLLERIARALERICSGQEALAVRLGGAEFALVFYQQQDAARAATLAAEVHAVFARPFDVDGAALAVTTVVGIAIAPDNVPDDREMIRRAEIAMSSARRRELPSLLYDPRQEASLREG